MTKPFGYISRHLANAFNPDRSGATTGERISFGAFWSLTGTLGTQLSAMLSGIIAARILGRTGYGELGMLASTIDALSVAAGLSLGVTLSKHLAETASNNPGRAGNILRMSRWIAFAISGTASLAFFIFSDWLAASLLDAQHLGLALRLASPMIFLGTVYGVQVGALSGLEAFRGIAGSNAIKALLQFPLVVAGAYFFSVEGAIAAMSFSSAAACLVSGRILGREIHLRGIAPSSTRIISEPGILMDFSVPAFLSSLLYSPAIWFSGLILATAPGGYAALGLFNAANQWKTFLLFLPDMISRAVIPVFSSLLTSGNAGEAKRLFKKLMLANALIAVPAALLIIGFGDAVIWLYGPQFSGGKPVLLLVVAGALLLALESPAGNIIAASGRMWAGFAMNLGWAATLVTCSLLFTGMGWGAAGLAAAYVAAYLLHGVWTVLYLLKLMRREGSNDGTPEDAWEKFWDKYELTPDYDHTSIAVFKEISDSCPRRKDAAVLECGSGAGKISALLAAEGAAVTLMDRSEKALEVSRRFFGLKGLNGAFTKGDIFSLPFGAGMFDLVWNSGVLEHFSTERQATALAEMKRVAKPSGRILVIVPFAHALVYRFGKFCAELMGNWPFGPEFPVSSLKKSAAAAGLKLVEEHSFDFASQLSFLKFVPGGKPLRAALGRLLNEDSGRRLFGGYLLICVLERETAI